MQDGRVPAFCRRWFSRPGGRWSARHGIWGHLVDHAACLRRSARPCLGGRARSRTVHDGCVRVGASLSSQHRLETVPASGAIRHHRWMPWRLRAHVGRRIGHEALCHHLSGAGRRVAGGALVSQDPEQPCPWRHCCTAGCGRWLHGRGRRRRLGTDRHHRPARRRRATALCHRHGKCFRVPDHAGRVPDLPDRPSHRSLVGSGRPVQQSLGCGRTCRRRPLRRTAGRLLREDDARDASCSGSSAF